MTERRPETCAAIVVGGGAAGLTTAIACAAAAPGERVVVLDGARKLGAKILVSGGGRCNVTHDVVEPEDFFGNRNVIRKVLREFPVEAVRRWFESLGVDLVREESGKLFPTTDSARTVLEALLARATQLGVELVVGAKVRGVSAGQNGFTLDTERGEYEGRVVALATGGRSLPKSGSDGSGYGLARALGHSVGSTVQALVPWELASEFFQAQLSGLTMDAGLVVFVDGKRVDARRGSLLWTHVGISGPLPMDSSRFIALALSSGATVRAVLDVWGESAEACDAAILAAAADHPKRTVQRFLGERLPRRFVEVLFAHLRLDAELTLGELPRQERRALVGGLVSLELPIRGLRGWNHAEVTAGGVPLDEIDVRTMMSRRCPGLYLAGEILDCDGRIGGFNFHWAWATGHLAGRGMAAALRARSAGETPTPAVGGAGAHGADK